MLILIFLSIYKCSRNLKIWEPRGLWETYKNKPLKYSIANFGHVPYGHSIFGSVYWGTPKDGCSDLQAVNWDNNLGSLILFLERGNCHYAEKVLNA